MRWHTGQLLVKKSSTVRDPSGNSTRFVTPSIAWASNAGTTSPAPSVGGGAEAGGEASCGEAGDARKRQSSASFIASIVAARVLGAGGWRVTVPGLPG